MRTWLPVEIGLPKHRKTRALARLWNTSPHTICGFLFELWGYLLEYQPDGDVSAMPIEDLNHMACDANGARVGVIGTVIEELQDVGFVDADGHAHDWEEYAGAILAKREKQRKRMQRLRKQEREGDANRSGTVSATSRAREGAVVQHSTAQQLQDKEHTGESEALRGLLADVPDVYREAIRGFVKSAQVPFAVVAELRGLMDGLHGKFDGATIGAACLRCATTVGRYDGRFIAKTCAQMQREAKDQPGPKAGQQDNPFHQAVA